MSIDADVLVVEDEDFVREQMTTLLTNEGYHCLEAGTAEAGLNVVYDEKPDVVLLDLKLPDREGTDIIEDILASSPNTFVFMITGEGDLEKAIDAFRKGATDFIQKPFNIDYVHKKIQNILTYRKTEQENRMLRRKLRQSDEEGSELVGTSSALEDVRTKIHQVANTGSTVLITGESGTGKEVVARRIHESREHENGHFIGINCASIPGELLESELFGHEKGAFTGAREMKKGYLETNEQDAVLLDEIGEMPMDLQPKLLRALEERSFYRVGGDELVSLEAQVIATTNRDLQKRVEQDQFREDLYFRLSVFEIRVPPLRERLNDVPLLAEHFVESFSREMNKECDGVSEEVLTVFQSYDWPGNVRELKNVIERAMIVLREHQHRRIQTKHLPDRLKKKQSSSSEEEETSEFENLKQAVNDFQRRYIIRVLERYDGDKKQAARALDIDLSTLYRKMDRLDISKTQETSQN